VEVLHSSVADLLWNFFKDIALAFVTLSPLLHRCQQLAGAWRRARGRILKWIARRELTG
jgi:hypothetical protein